MHDKNPWKNALRNPSAATSVRSEDERLGSILFSGFIDTQKNGLPTQKFIRKGSKEERDCRKAVARLLRSGKPLTQDFRDGLAGLFDRARGRRRDHVRDTAIAMDVYHNIRDGDGVEEALNKASTSFGLSISTVRDIWGHGKTRKGSRELIEAIHGPAKVGK